MGAQPGQAAERSVAVRRITDELMRPRSGVGRNYFALVIVDQSAATVEQLLRECAASPFLSGLPIRLRGIASRDDRRPRPDSAASPEIVVSPTGSWSRGELIDELRRYGDELLRHFATGEEHGLTHDELGVLRTRYQEHAAPEHRRESAVPGVQPPQDILSPQSNLPQPQDSRRIQPDHSQRSRRAEQVGVPDTPKSEGSFPGLMQPVQQEPVAPKSRRRPRHLPEMRWLRAQGKDRMLRSNLENLRQEASFTCWSSGTQLPTTVPPGTVSVRRCLRLTRRSRRHPESRIRFGHYRVMKRP